MVCMKFVCDYDQMRVSEQYESALVLSRFSQELIRD